MTINYGIILLGATISLSLFIRICVVCGSVIEENGAKSVWTGAPRVGKNDDNVLKNDFHIWEDTDEPLLQNLDKRLLKSTLLSSDFYRNNEAEVDDLVNDVFQSRKLNQELLSSRRKKSPKPKALNEKFRFDDDFYDEHICGIVHHEHSHEIIQDEHDEYKYEAPEGCVYNNKYPNATTLDCFGQELKEVPDIPPFLKSLNFRETFIDKILPSDFGNVSIGTITLIQNSIKFISPLAFEKIQNLKTLEILGNQLEFLSFDIYAGLTELITLYLDSNQISFKIYENCSIRDVEDIPLVLPNLMVFGLKGNPLVTIPEQMWAGLRESPVKMLDLSSCMLEHIHNATFTFLPQLTTLYLSDNPKLMNNLDIAFEGLKNTTLENLSLGKNNLDMSKIWPLLGRMGHSLKILDLSENRIPRIEEIPPALSNLKALNLANCEISFISPKVMESLPNLVEIDLKYNFLTILPSLEAQSQLVHINLDFSAMVTGSTGNMDPTFVIHDNSFRNNAKLRSLLLAGSPIKQIRKNTFSGLVSLLTLDLDNTCLESIADESFEDLGKLETLLLRGNPKLTTINSLTFYGLQSLKLLNMEDCNIEFPDLPRDESEMTTETALNLADGSTRMEDPFNPFFYMPALKWLQFSGNNIVHIFPRLFQYNENIIEINFKGNKIVSWDKPVLEKNYALRRLSKASNEDNEFRQFIISNRLKFFTDAIIEDLTSFRPHETDFSENTFACDEGACKLRDLIRCNPFYALPNDQPPSIIPTNTCEGHFLNLTWINAAQYTCTSSFDRTDYKILNVPDRICNANSKIGGEDPLNNNPDSSLAESGLSPTVIVVVSVVCLSAFLAALTAVGYKKRAHLKYVWFSVKLNVGKVPRKSKTSVIELIQYDYDVFISYHNADRDFIQEKFLPEIEEVPKLQQHIISISGEKSTGNKMPSVIQIGGESYPQENKGFRVCLHERDFEAGMPITDNIIEAVDHSKKVVILVSKNYLESQWCTFEMNLAYHRLVESRRKAFVVVLLEDIPSNLRTKVLNYLLRSRTYLEWPGNGASSQDLQRFWTRLRRSLMSS